MSDVESPSTDDDASNLPDTMSDVESPTSADGDATDLPESEPVPPFIPGQTFSLPDCPDHLIIHAILPFVPLVSLNRLAGTNSRFHTLCVSNEVWYPRASKFLLEVPEMPVGFNIREFVVERRCRYAHAIGCTKGEKEFCQTVSFYVGLLLSLCLTHTLAVVLFVVIAVAGFANIAVSVTSRCVLWVIFAVGTICTSGLGISICVLSCWRQSSIDRVTRWLDYRSELALDAGESERSVSRFARRQTKSLFSVGFGVFGGYVVSIGCVGILLAVIACLALKGLPSTTGVYFGSMLGALVFAFVVEILVTPIFCFCGCKRLGKKNNVATMTGFLIYITVIAGVCFLPAVIVVGLYSDGMLRTTIGVAMIPFDVFIGCCLFGAIFGSCVIGCLPLCTGDSEVCSVVVPSILMYLSLGVSCLCVVASLVLVPLQLASVISGSPAYGLIPAIMAGFCFLLSIYVITPGVLFLPTCFEKKFAEMGFCEILREMLYSR